MVTHSVSGWALTDSNFDRILCNKSRAFKSFCYRQIGLITHVVKNSLLVRINSRKFAGKFQNSLLCIAIEYVWMGVERVNIKRIVLCIAPLKHAADRFFNKNHFIINSQQCPTSCRGISII